MSGSSSVLPRKFVMLVAALGVCLVLLLVAAGVVRAQQMMATWYGPGFEGATTASGEPFDPNDYTAAHKTLPFGTKLIVTYNGKSVVVRVNDRGPYAGGYDLDLSQAAAEYIGLTGTGAVNVQTADASTPTGPYNGEATASQEQPATRPAHQQETSQQEAQQQRKAQPQTPQARQPAAGASRGPAASLQVGGTAEVDASAPAGQDQYADAQQQQSADRKPRQSAPDKQDAAVAQYQDGESDRQQAEVQPPAPEQVETTPAKKQVGTIPAKLVKPNSAAERWVELVELAEARPAGSNTGRQEPAVQSVEQAPTPAEHEEGKQKSAAGITVLPDTGGVPLGALVVGGLILCFGAITVRRAFG